MERHAVTGPECDQSAKLVAKLRYRSNE